MRRLIFTATLIAIVSAISGCSSMVQSYMKSLGDNINKSLAEAQEKQEKMQKERQREELDKWADSARKASQKYAESCRSNPPSSENVRAVFNCKVIERMVGKWHGTSCHGDRTIDLDIVGMADSIFADVWNYAGKGTVTFTGSQPQVVSNINVSLMERTGFVHISQPVPFSLAAYGKMDSPEYKSLNFDLAPIEGIDGLSYPERPDCLLTLRREGQHAALPATNINQVFDELGHHYKQFSDNTAMHVWMGYAEKFIGDDTGRLYTMAKLYFDIGSEFDKSYYNTALKNYLLVAKRSNRVDAQIALGRMYANGLGTEKNDKEAKRWFAMAKPMLKKAYAVCHAETARQRMAQELLGMKKGTPLSQLESVPPARIDVLVPGTEFALTKIDIPNLRTLAGTFTCRYHYSTDLTRRKKIDLDSIKDEESPLFASEEEEDRFYDNQTTSLIVGYAMNTATSILAAGQFVDLTVTPEGVDHYALTGTSNLEPVNLNIHQNAGKSTN